MPFTILHTFPTNAQGRGMAFKGSFLWLAVLQINFPPPAGSLEQINKTTGALTDHSAGLSAFAFQALYDAPNDQFWTSPAGGGSDFSIARYNGSGALLSNPTNLAGNNPYAICATPTHLWAANTGSSNVSVFDVITGALITTVAVPNPGPSTGVGVMIYHAGSVWLPNASAELIQFDDASMTIANDFTVAGVTRFGGMVLAAGNLWATDLSSRQLYKMDFAGNVLNTYVLSPASLPGPIAFDGTYFWILDFANRAIVVNLSGVGQGSVGIPGNPQWIACDGTTPNQAWASTGTPDEVLNLLFTPPSPPATGGVIGTFAAQLSHGKAGGGTK